MWSYSLTFLRMIHKSICNLSVLKIYAFFSHSLNKNGCWVLCYLNAECVFLWQKNQIKESANKPLYTVTQQKEAPDIKVAPKCTQYLTMKLQTMSSNNNSTNKCVLVLKLVYSKSSLNIFPSETTCTKCKNMFLYINYLSKLAHIFTCNLFIHTHQQFHYNI